MQVYEYKVIPAPRRGEKAKGARSVAEKFGVALANAMNAQAREGWEYLRADTLPCDERVGLTGSATHFQHMLVFRRAIAQPATLPLAAAAAAAPATASVAAAEAAAFLDTPDEGPTRVVPFTARSVEGHAAPVGPATAPPPASRS
jgi:hypothetical protein